MSPQALAAVAVATMLIASSTHAADSAYPLSNLRVEDVLEKLRHGDQLARMQALSELQNRGSAGSPAAPDLIKILADDRDPSIRYQAAIALAEVAPQEAETEPAFDRALKDPAPIVRKWAVWGLKKVGHISSASLSGLVRMGADSDAEVRTEALVTLRELAIWNPETIDVARQLVHDPSWQPRYGAIRLLVSAGPAASSAVGDLARALSDEDSQIRWAATDALAAIGPRAQGAERALVETLDDRDSHVRGGAAHALGEIRAQTPEAAKALRHHLDDPDASTRGWAVRALGQLGENARSSIPALIKLLDDPMVGPAAIHSLGQLARLDVDSVTTALIRTGNGAVAFEFAAIGPTAVPSLIAVIKSSNDENIRALSIEAIAFIGPSANAALPALEDALHDKSALVRDNAEKTLRTINGK